jgi:hypothetical protein
MPPASSPLPTCKCAPFSSASLPGTGITLRLKIRLKIPGVATHVRGQQELAPNRSGGRAARDDLVPGYTAGVSPALLSTASSLSAASLHHGLGSQRAVRRETPVSPACSPLTRGDSHPSGKRTWISFTCGLGAPKRHDLVSLAPPSSMPQFGPICMVFAHHHPAAYTPSCPQRTPVSARPLGTGRSLSWPTRKPAASCDGSAASAATPRGPLRADARRTPQRAAAGPPAP